MNILYNGMIAPLGKFGLRGVAWYQGEANAGLDDALRYQVQLQMLFTDWRRHFDFALPFFVVQLANWNALVTTPVDSGWARLRDAQRRAVAADGNAGLAITIDIGNRDDIHPTNKQDVGKRLSRAARHVIFGEKISASGAAPKEAKRTLGGVEVTLGDYDGNLLVIGAKDPAGFELCGDTQTSCHFVRAQLGEGGVVRLEDTAPREGHARALLLGRRAAVQSLRHAGTAGGAVRAGRAVVRSSQPDPAGVSGWCWAAPACGPDGGAQRYPGAPSAEPVPGFASVRIVGGRSCAIRRYAGSGVPTVII